MAAPRPPALSFEEHMAAKAQGEQQGGASFAVGAPFAAATHATPLNSTATPATKKPRRKRKAPPNALIIADEDNNASPPVPRHLKDQAYSRQAGPDMLTPTLSKLSGGLSAMDTSSSSSSRASGAGNGNESPHAKKKHKTSPPMSGGASRLARVSPNPGTAPGLDDDDDNRLKRRGSSRSAMVFSYDDGKTKILPSPNCSKLASRSMEDLLEGGLSREYLSFEMATPGPRDADGKAAWRYTHVTCNQAKTKFRMYDDKTGRFLLSASLLIPNIPAGDFLISQYKDFPDVHHARTTSESSLQANGAALASAIAGGIAGGVAATRSSLSGLVGAAASSSSSASASSASGAGGDAAPLPLSPAAAGPKTHWCCAVLKKPSGKGFALLSRSCDPCDSILYKDCACALDFVAGRCLAPELGKAKLRQCLGEMTHRTRKVQCGKGANDFADARYITVAIPTVDDDERCTKGFCSRFPRRTHATAEADANVTSYHVKLPTWNPNLCSLSLKFIGNRVKKSSKKNFIMTLKDTSTGATTKTKQRGDTPCLQFGKVRRGKYNLDFRYPVSPIQAFATVLTSFSWLGDDGKKKQK